MNLTTYQKIVCGFLVVILLGTWLLSLPISQLEGSQATILDHLFTTTSMVCVTGLSTIAVASTYTFFGQVVCVVLMQIGGLGWLTIVSLSIIWAKDKLGLKEQVLVQDALNRQSSFKISTFLQRLLVLTLTIEGVAALLLMIEFVPRYQLDGVWKSIFIAVSAFCNAGFDNIGSSSLQQFISNPLINGVVSLLIIFGGLGFSVWHELIDKVTDWLSKKKDRTKKRRLSHHTVMVLTATVWLLCIGTLATFLLEYHNVETIGALSFGEKLWASFFQSVTMRTAGFATIDYGQALPVTNFVYILLMIIGGAPGGTAGGIKVTTLVVLVLLVVSIFKGHYQVVYRYRQLSLRLIKQALVIVVFFMSVLLLGYFLLLVVNPHLSAMALWFESVSALATVGVTMGITSQLSVIGKLIIIALMFIGRIGPMTVLLSVGKQAPTKEIQRVKTTILIG